VEHSQCGYDERKEEMKCKESCEGSVSDGESPSKPLN